MTNPQEGVGAREAAIRARNKAALDMVHALCQPAGSHGARSWSMSIPARPDYDPDLVIAASLRDVETLLAALAVSGTREDGLREAAEWHEAEATRLFSLDEAKLARAHQKYAEHFRSRTSRIVSQPETDAPMKCDCIDLEDDCDGRTGCANRSTEAAQPPCDSLASCQRQNFTNCPCQDKVEECGDQPCPKVPCCRDQPDPGKTRDEGVRIWNAIVAGKNVCCPNGCEAEDEYRACSADQIVRAALSSQPPRDEVGERKEGESRKALSPTEREIVRARYAQGAKRTRPLPKRRKPLKSTMAKP